jgi:hypothetical protein
MIMKGTGKILLGTVLLLVAGAQQGLAQQQLRWKFQPGEQFKVTVEQKTVSTTRVADQSLKMMVELAVEEKWDVRQVAASGVATIDRSLTRIQLTIRSGVEEEITFDSASERTAPGMARAIAKVLGPVLEKPMRIQVDPRGAVVDVELGEKLKGQLVELAKELGEFFSPDSIQQQLMTIGRLPAGPVSVGESWMESVESTTPLGKLSVVRTFTYEGEKSTSDGLLSEIVIVGQIKLVPSADGNDRKATLRDQKLSGVLRFDAVAGRLVESTEQQKLGIQTVYRELRIQSDVTTTTRTTVTPLSP